MTDFRLRVTYAAGDTQEHDGLDAERAYTGTGAFLRDLTSLEGRGVKRVTLEVDDGEPTPDDVARNLALSVKSFVEGVGFVAPEALGLHIQTKLVEPLADYFEAVGA